MVEERGEEEATLVQSCYVVGRRRRKVGSRKLDWAQTSERLVKQLGVLYPPWRPVGLRHRQDDQPSRALLGLLRVRQIQDA